MNASKVSMGSRQLVCSYRGRARIRSAGAGGSPPESEGLGGFVRPAIPTKAPSAVFLKASTHSLSSPVFQRCGPLLLHLVRPFDDRRLLRRPPFTRSFGWRGGLMRGEISADCCMTLWVSLTAFHESDMSDEAVGQEKRSSSCLMYRRLRSASGTPPSLVSSNLLVRILSAA